MRDAVIISYELFLYFGNFVQKNQKQPPELFYKKAVLKNVAIFTGRYLCWSLAFLHAFRPATLLKIDHTTGVFL